MHEIFEIESLDDLETFLGDQGHEDARAWLAEEFFKVCEYKNAGDWNRLVRLCEALAIVGWGDLEPVQAVRGTFFNGNPETRIYNRYSELRYVDAIWSKRKSGLTMEPGRTAYHASPDVPNKPSIGDAFPVVECIQNIKLESQRNWITKSPILITRPIDNCYSESRPLVNAVEECLSPAIDRRLTSTDYGSAINRIVLIYHLSYPLPGCGGENFVTYDDEVKLTSQKQYERLLTLYSEQQIEENGYYLRKRIAWGAFSAAKGVMKVELHFPQKFGQQPVQDQKREFAGHLDEALIGVVERLKKKKVQFELDALSRDFKGVVTDWVQQPTSDADG